MRDCGLLDRWWRASAGDWDGCVATETENTSNAVSSLTLGHIEGIAYLWAVSLAAAIIVYFFEYATSWKVFAGLIYF